MTDLMLDENSGYRKIYDVLEKIINVPFLVAIGNNKIIDTYEFSKEGNLEEFLIKNNFINE